MATPVFDSAVFDPTVFDAGPAAGGGDFGTVPGLFYPRISFGSSQIDFPNPAQLITIQESQVRGQNISLSGFQETLSVRIEYILTILFQATAPATMTLVRDWWRTWASLGKQSAVILDATLSGTGAYEYDLYNTFFDKAECELNPFNPTRLTPKRSAFMQIQLTFRQGQAS
jgi:hypothetical protein